MAVNRRAAKRDGNEGAIIEALRAAGATVQQLSAKGVPDLLVGYHGWNILLEVKMPKAGLTKDQREWHQAWHGGAHIVESVDEALYLLNTYYTRWVWLTNEQKAWE